MKTRSISIIKCGAFALLWSLILTFICCAAFAEEGWHTGASKYVPAKYRSKIDYVDLSDSPRVKIGMTFLTNNSTTVEEPRINAFKIYCNQTVVANITEKDRTTKTFSRDEVSFFTDEDIPLDLAIVLPMSYRFSDDERQNMVDSIKNNITSILGNEDYRSPVGDRVSIFIDDGRMIVRSKLGEGGEAEDDAGMTKMDIAKVEELLDSTAPAGRRAYLYSSIERAMDDMTSASKLREPSRRVMILVTDGLDSSIVSKEDVAAEIRSLYTRARENQIHIYVVMFEPLFESLVPMFEGLSRKTGGTFREADFEDLPKKLSAVGAEIFRQYILSFEMPRASEGRKCVFKVETTLSEKQPPVKSTNSAEMVFGKSHFNWHKFFVGCIIGVIVLVILLIVFLIVRKVRKKKQEEAEALKEQEIKEKIEKGEVCPKCRRTMMPDWKECMFCAAALQEEMKAAKAAEAEKKAAEAKAKGAAPAPKKDERTCGKCGRVMMPTWTECLFCKAGIGAGDEGKNSKAKQGIGLAAAGAAAGAAGVAAAAPAARICPVCKREMKEHWTECLYCAADGSTDRGQPAAAAQPEPVQETPAVRTCPDCGRPMKEHWTECLYCVANRSR